MERPVITALADLLRGHVPLSKSRLETMALLTVAMIGARRVNLVHVADERGWWVRPRLTGGCSGFSSMCGGPGTGPRR